MKAAPNTAPTTRRVLALLEQPMTQAQLRAATGLSADSVQSALSRLIENGRVLRMGEHGSSHYVRAGRQPPSLAGGATLGPASDLSHYVPATAPTWPAPRTAASRFGCPLLAASHALEVSPC